LELLALEAEGQAKVVSSPHLVVSDNQAAFIQQGKEVPFLEASASGAASVKFKQAELELKVKPQITPNNDIIMDIVVKKDQVSNDTAAGGVPIIDTRKIKTQLLTNNGQTVVLGGIHEKRQETRNKQVPLLGDMPFLGWLFKNREHKVEKKELLIFITPKITKHLNKANTS
jgi:type IV pilus assembly protein PilQ